MVNEKRLLENFLAYLQIDSETGDEKAMAERLVKDLAAIGCEVSVDDIGEKAHSTGHNVYAVLPGDPNLEPILLSSHMDTVIPGKGVEPYTAEDGYIRSKGDTILGGDDKSGVASIIEALHTVIEQKLPHRTVEAVFTVREESGMYGSKNLDYDRLTAKRAVVFDSGGPIGNIIVQAPGQMKLYATVLGRAAHAGNSPEAGISAIQVAAHGVAAMNLLRIDSETSCNIGTFEAVGPTNIVSPKVSIEAEIRSRNPEKLDAQLKHMTGCLQTACDKFGAKLEYKTDLSYPGFFLEDSHPLVQTVSKAIEAMGLTPTTGATGGGSDANVFNQRGIPAVNLSVGMDKVHTTNEQYLPENLGKTAELALRLMLA